MVDASAATPGAAREQAQNHRISRVIEVTRQIAVKLGNVGGSLNTLAGVTAGNVQALKDLQTLTGQIDTRLKGIEAAAPVILDALTKLKDGLTAAGAGLQKLGDAYQAVEYGRAALSAGDADLTIAAGGAGTSADIPDDGNAISVSDDAFVVAGAGATTETLDLRALIRSAESDGDSSSKTAGQAGGFLQLSNADTGARIACTGVPSNPPGILGTAPGDTIVTPSGSTTSLPLKNIPGGHSRTDTTEPTGSNGTNLFPSALPACSFTATPGTTYRAHWSVQFLDIPTSTTPGPTE
ncbi:MAG TPA: hypothetical protein VGC71_02610 [Gaiellales bacterium]